MSDATADETATTAIDRFPSGLPASLYDIAQQYVACDWYGTVSEEEIDFDIAPEHLAALTPTAKQQLFGEPDSLITIHVDLTDPDMPQLAADPVSIESLSADLKYRVGHSYPDPKTSSMTDYSVTTHKSANAHHLAGYRDDAWGTNNVRDRFTDWAHSDAADQVLNEYDGDTTVLRALRVIGDTDAELDRLSEAFINMAGSEDETFDALITVAVHDRDDDGNERVRYPGEIPVLNEVTSTQRTNRIATINVADDAHGPGVDYLTGDETTVYGGAAGLFSQYGKQQREHFPALSPDGSDAWRTLSVSGESASVLATANLVVEDFYRGVGNGRRVYVLPYLAARRSEISPDEFDWFYSRVFLRLRNAPHDDFENVIEDMYRDMIESAASGPDHGSPFNITSHGYWNDVRFALVFVVTGNPDRVYASTMDATYLPATLADAHARVVTSGPFAPDGIFRRLPGGDTAQLLDPEASLHRRILFGSYWEQTTEPERDSRKSEDRSAGSTDDTRLRYTKHLLTDDPIPTNELVEGYVHDLIQTQAEQAADDDAYNAWIGAPVTDVAEQFAQLRALATADLLTPGSYRFDRFVNLLTESTATTGHEATMSETDTDTAPDDDGTDNEWTRSDQLDDFIADHPLLADPQRKAVFLLGGLVGRLSMYQRSNNVSSTLINRFPIEYVTKRSLVEVTKDVLQMQNEYIEADDKASSQMNARYIEPLPDAMLSGEHPHNWDLSTDELQWLYALGISYGVGDSPIDDGNDDDDDEDGDSSTDAETSDLEQFSD